MGKSRRHRNNRNIVSPQSPRVAILWRGLLQVGIVSLITIFLCAVAVEVLMRFFPRYFPVSLALQLPAEPRRHILTRHGAQSESTLNGDGMIYWKDPVASLDPFTIDVNGYRNPDVPDDNHVDVVLLGDSLLIAENAREDLATHIRHGGLSAYSLGMGGYGPMQYRDAYEKFIHKPGISQNCIVILVCAANDFSDTDKYLKVSEAGGDYRDYMGRAPEATEDGGILWSLALARVLFQNLETTLAPRQQLAQEEMTSIVLPYTRFEAPVALIHHLNTMPVYPVSIEYAINALLDVARSAPRALVVLMPSFGGIYAPYMSDHPDERLLFEITYEYLAKGMENNFERNSIAFLNARASMRAATRREIVTARPDDYHLNDAGVRVIYEAISPFLNGCKPDNEATNARSQTTIKE